MAKSKKPRAAKNPQSRTRLGRAGEFLREIPGDLARRGKVLGEISGEMVRRDFGPIAVFPGNISLATGCTWQTIWDGPGVFDAREYRINNQGGAGGIEVEVDGVVVVTLGPSQSQDVKGKKIRVHAPSTQTGPSTGSYERL